MTDTICLFKPLSSWSTPSLSCNRANRKSIADHCFNDGANNKQPNGKWQMANGKRRTACLQHDYGPKIVCTPVKEEIICRSRCSVRQNKRTYVSTLAYIYASALKQLAGAELPGNGIMRLIVTRMNAKKEIKTDQTKRSITEINRQSTNRTRINRIVSDCVPHYRVSMPHSLLSVYISSLKGESSVHGDYRSQITTNIYIY